MKKEKEEKERVRKTYTHGQRTQKSMTFRADNDVVEYLSTVINKGRLLNDLVREHYRRKYGDGHDDGLEIKEPEYYEP